MLGVLFWALGVGVGSSHVAHGLHCSAETEIHNCHEQVCVEDVDDHGHEHHQCVLSPDAVGPFVKGRSLVGKLLSVALISQRRGTLGALIEKDRPFVGWASPSGRTSTDLLGSVLLRL